MYKTNKSYVDFYERMTNEMMTRGYDNRFITGAYRNLINFNAKLRSPKDYSDLEKIMCSHLTKGVDKK